MDMEEDENHRKGAEWLGEISQSTTSKSSLNTYSTGSLKSELGEPAHFANFQRNSASGSQRVARSTLALPRKDTAAKQTSQLSTRISRDRLNRQFWDLSIFRGNANRSSISRQLTARNFAEFATQGACQLITGLLFGVFWILAMLVMTIWHFFDPDHTTDRSAPHDDTPQGVMDALVERAPATSSALKFRELTGETGGQPPKSSKPTRAKTTVPLRRARESVTRVAPRRRAGSLTPTVPRVKGQVKQTFQMEKCANKANLSRTPIPNALPAKGRPKKDARATKKPAVTLTEKRAVMAAQKMPGKSQVTAISGLLLKKSTFFNLHPMVKPATKGRVNATPGPSSWSMATGRGITTNRRAKKTIPHTKWSSADEMVGAKEKPNAQGKPTKGSNTKVVVTKLSSSASVSMSVDDQPESKWDDNNTVEAFVNSV